MTISKGEIWGTSGPAPAGLLVANSDAALARLVANAGIDAGAITPTAVCVTSGDLLATVGGTPDPNLGTPNGPAERMLDLEGTVDPEGTARFERILNSTIRQLLPIDLGFVRLDDSDEIPFVAHVLLHRRLGQGECAAIMNAAWRSDWYLGPRAHPNDGLLDVTVGTLGWQDRLGAVKRFRSGTHIPHPDLQVRRVPAWTHEFRRPTPVAVDGVRVGTARTVAVRLVEDAFVLVV